MRAFSTSAAKFQVSRLPPYAAGSIGLITGSAVFKIPPLKKNEGHRAQEWGDLGNPLWKGRLRIIERSSGVAIQFEDPTTGECGQRAHDMRLD